MFVATAAVTAALCHRPARDPENCAYPTRENMSASFSCGHSPPAAEVIDGCADGRSMQQVPSAPPPPSPGYRPRIATTALCLPSLARPVGRGAPRRSEAGWRDRPKSKRNKPSVRDASRPGEMAWRDAGRLAASTSRGIPPPPPPPPRLLAAAALSLLRSLWPSSSARRFRYNLLQRNDSLEGSRPSAVFEVDASERWNPSAFAIQEGQRTLASRHVLFGGGRGGRGGLLQSAGGCRRRKRFLVRFQTHGRAR